MKTIPSSPRFRLQRDKVTSWRVLLGTVIAFQRFGKCDEGRRQSHFGTKQWCPNCSLGWGQQGLPPVPATLPASHGCPWHTGHIWSGFSGPALVSVVSESGGTASLSVVRARSVLHAEGLPGLSKWLCPYCRCNLLWSVFARGQISGFKTL